MGACPIIWGNTIERRDFEYYLANLQEWKQVTGGVQLLPDD